MNDSCFKEIKILTECYVEIEKIVQQSEQFETVSDYVNFVLKEMLFGEDDAVSNEEREALKKRLKSLGYL